METINPAIHKFVTFNIYDDIVELAKAVGVFNFFDGDAQSLHIGTVSVQFSI